MNSFFLKEKHYIIINNYRLKYYVNGILRIRQLMRNVAFFSRV
jgi:hypothetical protein